MMSGSSGSVAFNETFVAPAADIASFIGTGTLKIDLDYTNDPMVTGCSNSQMCTASGTLTWADAPGTIEIDYETVPEPSTWALIGTGFAAAGLWRMRKGVSRRNAARAA
jgi:hypothetical protein